MSPETNNPQNRERGASLHFAPGPRHGQATAAVAPTNNEAHDRPPNTPDDNRPHGPATENRAPPLSIIVRDFERAVVDSDDDGDDAEYLSPRARRGTTARSISPPNSVKAFAAARRRSRRNTNFSDDSSELEAQLARIRSMSGGRDTPGSVHERPASNFTRDMSDDDGDSADEDDSEDKAQFGINKEHLHINFDFLERFMNTERPSQQNSSSRPAPSPRIFPDLRSQSANRRSSITGENDILGRQASGSVDLDEEKNNSSVLQLKPSLEEKSRFSFCSSAWESTHCANELADLAPAGGSFRELFDHSLNEDGVWWLNCMNATREEIQALGKTFGVHPLTIEDIITQETREKVELFRSYYFAVFESFDPVEEDGDIEYEGFNVYLLVFMTGVLSFSFVPNTHASFVRQKMMALKESVFVSSDWICYATIDHIVDEFGPVIRKIEAEVDAIDDDVFIMRDDDSEMVLKRIGTARKNCMALYRLLGGKADVLGGFTKRCNEKYPIAPRMDIGMYLSDIQDHVVTMTTNITHFETILARAHSNYLATVSIDNHRQGDATIGVLNKITTIAAIFVPLQLISIMFGMNVQVPWQTKDGTNLSAFLGILGCMVAFAIIVFTVARYLKILK